MEIRGGTVEIKLDTRTEEEKEATLGSKACCSEQLQEPSRVVEQHTYESKLGYIDVAEKGSSIKVDGILYDLTSKELKDFLCS